MSNIKFTHLAVQSDYSLLEGYGTIEEYVKLAKEKGQDSIALTDHNSLLGVYKFIYECHKNNIKPIVGVTMNLAPKHEDGAKHLDYVEYSNTIPVVWKGSVTRLRLYAKNKEGLLNLFKLVEESYKPENFFHYPRIDLDILKKYSNNLMCLSGDRFSEISCRIRASQYNEALKEAAILKEIFGDDFYIELIPIIDEPDETILSSSIKIAKKVGVKTIVTNDVYYPNRGDEEIQEKILALGNKNKISETPVDKGGLRFRYTAGERYLKSGQEIVEYMNNTIIKKLKATGDKSSVLELSKAIQRTQEIADKVQNVTLEYDNQLRPHVEIPEEFGNSYEYMKFLIDKGFKLKRAGCSKEVQEKSKKQTAYELEILYANDFVDYFITVKSTIDWARSQGQLVGPGRGSCTGSEIAYLLDISRTDPIRFDLMFERFISPGRGATYELTYEDGSKEVLNIAENKIIDGEKRYIYQIDPGMIVDGKKLIESKIIDPGSSPDIDTDYTKDFRKEIIRHTQEEYGFENVAALMTPGPFKNKNAWKSMCTVYGINSVVANRISELIPAGDDGETIADFYYENGEFADEGADLRLAVDKPELKAAMEDAIKLQGRQRETGVHACGIVISKEPLNSTIPLMIRQDDGMVVTQWNYAECESLGLIKMDYLGLDTLDIIQDTLASIEETTGEVITTLDIINSDLSDKKVLELFQRGDTFGIFQFSKDGVRQLLREVHPTEFMELAAITALYRPGPIGMKLHTDFAKRKNDESARVPFHKSFEGTKLAEILEPTLGACIYQEQVMQIATQCAGFTSQEADKLRKAMGKKDLNILLKYEDKFLQGLLSHGYSNSKANKELWEGLKGFARYAFNKSHATSYALNSYQTAFLKVHYPVHFMATLLNRKFGRDDFSSFYDEAERMGIKLIPPDINTSKYHIAPSADLQSISYGLGYIKTLPDDFLREIINERDENGKYKDLYDLIKRIPSMSASRLKGLAAVGCLDSLGVSRKAVFENAGDVIKQVQRIKERESHNSLFDLINVGDVNLNEIKLADDDWGIIKKLQHEARMTGIYLSSNPINELILPNGSHIDSQTPLNELLDIKSALNKTQYITFMKIINKKASNGERYIIALINNGVSQVEIKIRGKIIQGILLNNALKKTENDMNKAIAMLGKTRDDFFDDSGVLNVPLLDPPKPFVIYKAKFLKTTKMWRPQLVDYKEIEISNNDRIWKDFKVIETLDEEGFDELIQSILSKDMEYQSSTVQSDIRIYNDYKNGQVKELYNLNNQSLLYDFGEVLELKRR